MHAPKTRSVTIRRAYGAGVWHVVAGYVDDCLLGSVGEIVAVDATRIPSFGIDVNLGLVLGREVQIVDVDRNGYRVGEVTLAGQKLTLLLGVLSWKTVCCLG